MAKLNVIGRLGNVAERNGGYVSFGVAEPSYEKDGERVTPWFNFLLKDDSNFATFLKKNKNKIDVVEVLANEREVKKDNDTTYFHTVTAINVITWKKDKEESEEDGASDESNYPWNQ